MRRNWTILANKQCVNCTIVLDSGLSRRRVILQLYFNEIRFYFRIFYKISKQVKSSQFGRAHLRHCISRNSSRLLQEYNQMRCSFMNHYYPTSFILFVEHVVEKLKAQLAFFIYSVQLWAKGSDLQKEGPFEWYQRRAS